MSPNSQTRLCDGSELGRQAPQVDVWGLTLTNAWDSANRLVAKTDSLGGNYTFTFDNANRITSRQFFGTGLPNVRVDYVYNQRNEVTEIKRFTDLAGTQLVSKSLYAFDDAGRLTSLTHQNGSGGACLTGPMSVPRQSCAYEPPDTTAASTPSGNVNYPWRPENLPQTDSCTVTNRPGIFREIARNF